MIFLNSASSAAALVFYLSLSGRSIKSGVHKEEKPTGGQGRGLGEMKFFFPFPPFELTLTFFLVQYTKMARTLGEVEYNSHLPRTLSLTGWGDLKSYVGLRILGMAPDVDKKGVALKVGEKVASHLISPAHSCAL